MFDFLPGVIVGVSEFGVVVIDRTLKVSACAA